VTSRLPYGADRSVDDPDLRALAPHALRCIAPQGGAPVNCTGAVGEDEEGGLNHVLGGVGVVQDSATDVEDHRAVTADECRERIVTAPGEEVGEELFVGRRRGGQAGDVR